MEAGNRKDNLIKSLGVQRFLNSHCKITYDTSDIIRGDIFYEQYKLFCHLTDYPIASRIFMGRLLGRVGVRASARIGGTKGTGQKTCYVGIQCEMLQVSTVTHNQEDEEINVFAEFVRRYYKLTMKTIHTVRQEDLYNFYKQYCHIYGYASTTITNINKFLKKLGVQVTNIGQEESIYVGMKSYVTLVPEDFHPDDSLTSSFVVPKNEPSSPPASPLTHYEVSHPASPLPFSQLASSPVSMPVNNFGAALPYMPAVDIPSLQKVLETCALAQETFPEQLPPNFPFLVRPDVLIEHCFPSSV